MQAGKEEGAYQQTVPGENQEQQSGSPGGRRNAEELHSKNVSSFEKRAFWGAGASQLAFWEVEAGPPGEIGFIAQPSWDDSAKTGATPITRGGRRRA